jgi:hypothetical protein
MSMFEPVVLTEAAESGSTSMAWRCTVCARIYLYEIEVERPVDCEGCEASQFVETCL